MKADYALTSLSVTSPSAHPTKAIFCCADTIAHALVHGIGSLVQGEAPVMIQVEGGEALWDQLHGKHGELFEITIEKKTK